MAEAIARAYGVDVTSAGTIPAMEINPMVVEVLKEKGLYLSSSKPKMLTSQMVEDADYVVTMGCKVEDVCPKPLVVKMEKKLVDWQIEDPNGKPIEEVRTIMSTIEDRVIELQDKTKK